MAEGRRIAQWWQHLWHGACYRCQASVSGRQLFCSACLTELPWLGQACARCALPLPDGTTTHCGECLRQPPPYERVLSLFEYSAPVDRLVADLKYHERLWAGRWFAELLVERFGAALHGTQLLVPVPLHSARLRQRGFNQALELALPLARHLGVGIARTAVRRRQPTREQAELSAAERKRNLTGAFACTPLLGIERATIVDDVMTTGATVRELALTLRDHGVGVVDVVTVARTPRGDGPVVQK
ncbi:MAG: ComF family protein [Thiotrichales bacterium]